MSRIGLSLIGKSCILLALVIYSGCDKVSINSGSIKGVQGSGVSTTEVRDLEDFHSIELQGVGTVNASIGQEQSVSVTTDDNLIGLIETKVEEGVLIVRPTESIGPRSGLTFQITTKQLKSLNVSGAGKFALAEISGPELSIGIDGAGSITGSGEVNALEITMDGAGSVSLADLKSKSTKIVISGAGSANVHASESIDAEVNGVGAITVHGNPETVIKNVSGIGRIKIVDE